MKHLRYVPKIIICITIYTHGILDFSANRLTTVVTRWYVERMSYKCIWLVYKRYFFCLFAPFWMLVNMLLLEDSLNRLPYSSCVSCIYVNAFHEWTRARKRKEKRRESIYSQVEFLPGLFSRLLLEYWLCARSVDLCWRRSRETLATAAKKKTKTD